MAAMSRVVAIGRWMKGVETLMRQPPALPSVIVPGATRLPFVNRNWRDGCRAVLGVDALAGGKIAAGEIGVARKVAHAIERLVDGALS